MSNHWVGIDLDKTVAEYHGWVHMTEIGAPIPRVVELIKEILAAGYEVRIFTARVDDTRLTSEEIDSVVLAINKWCIEHIGQPLRVTNRKDLDMFACIDDRAWNIEPNTGIMPGLESFRKHVFGEVA